MTEWIQENPALVTFLVALVSVGIPGLVALLVARRYQPSAEAQEAKLKAETAKMIAEVNSEVQDQLREALADRDALIAKLDASNRILEERVSALEDALQSERVERARLEDELEVECGLRKELELKLQLQEVKLERVHAWAKALEAQVIELGATPVPFSKFAS